MDEDLPPGFELEADLPPGFVVDRRAAKKSAPVQPMAVDPSEGMSGVEKFLVGTGASMDKAYRGLKGLVGGDTTEGDENAALYQQHRPEGWQTTAGEITGDIAAAAPVALVPGGLPAQMAAAAAGNAAMTPGDITDRAAAGATGAVGAGVGNLLTKTLGRVMKPIGDKAKDVLELEARGIKPTFGQAMAATDTMGGRSIGKLEDAAQHVPLVSGPLRKSREAAMEQWQQATRTAAMPKGATGPSGTVSEVGQSIGKAYDDILSNVRFPRASVTYKPDVRKLTAGQALSNEQRTMLNDTFEAIRLKALQNPAPGVQPTAAAAQQVESALKSKAATFKASADPAQRELGMAFDNLAHDFGGTWRNALGPTQKAAVGEIDKAYPNYAAIRQAAKSAGAVASDAVPSNYSPAVLTRAAKTVDRSPMKSKYIAGNAPQQELARLGSRLTEKRSGDRINELVKSVAGATAGASAAMAGGLHSLPVAAGIFAYGTKPVQDYMMGRMAPTAQEALMQALRRNAGYGAATGAGLIQQME